MFVDSGYACHNEEMQENSKKIIPDYEKSKKVILVTHAAVDHCGLLPMFDEVMLLFLRYSSVKSEKS